MSFVISELPRELTFNAEGRRRPTLGPNLGPGCYESLVPSKKSAAKPPKATGVLPAAFGSSERRRLNNPISEMLQDLTQFRVIPGVSKNTFASGSGGVSDPFAQDPETAKNERRQQLEQQILKKQAKRRGTLRDIHCSDSKSSLLYQYEMARKNLLESAIDLKELKNLQNYSSSYADNHQVESTQSEVHSKSFDQRAQFTKKNLRKKFNMQRILEPMRDYHQHRNQMPSIQCQSVKVIENEDEEIDSYTQEASTGLTHLSAQLNQTPNKGNLVKKRGDSHILAWKSYVKEVSVIKGKCRAKVAALVCGDRRSFIQEHLNQKRYMMRVGPGSYNLGEHLQVSLPQKDLRKRRRSVDQTMESQRILHLAEAKKVQLRMQRGIQNEKQEKTVLEKPMIQTSQSTSIVPYNPNPLGRSPLPLQNVEGAVFITEEQPMVTAFFNHQISHQGSTMQKIRKSINSLSRSHLDSSLAGEDRQLQSKLSRLTMQKEQLGNPSLGPGSYTLPGGFQEPAKADRATYRSQPPKIPHFPDRFDVVNKNLEKSRKMPGPGQYSQGQEISINNTQSKSPRDTNTLPEKQQVIVSSGNPSRLQKIEYPSFGSRVVRNLNLINEEQTKEAPGPGKYDLEPINLEDLLRQCDDKRLVKEIISNLQERMPSSYFISNYPRIAVFQENKLKKEDQGLEKFYNQDLNTIGDGQLKLSQKKLEQMILKLRKTEMTSSTLSVSGINHAPPKIQGPPMDLQPLPLEDGMNYMLLETNSSIVLPNLDKSASIESQVPQLRSAAVRIAQPSAVFRSRTIRNPHGLLTTSYGQQTSSTATGTEAAAAAGLYQTESGMGQNSTWEKKSFNMKYNKRAQTIMGKQLFMNRQSKSVLNHFQQQQ